MTTAQLAAVSYLVRYSGRSHTLYAYQLRQWVQRAHVELYIRGSATAA